MTNKKRNNGKRQIPSIDDKEFYEIFMRNHDECKKKIHDLVTSYLKVHKIEQTSCPKQGKYGMGQTERTSTSSTLYNT